MHVEPEHLIPPVRGTSLSRSRDVATLRLLHLSASAVERYNQCYGGHPASEPSGDRGRLACGRSAPFDHLGRDVPAAAS